MTTKKEYSFDVEDIFDAHDNEKEGEIHSYCRENKLDVSNASDYSKAALAVLDYMPPVSRQEAETVVLIADTLTQNSNLSFLEMLSTSRDIMYNERCNCEDINNSGSDYGLFDKKCPKGTAEIKPSFWLNQAQKVDEKIKPFKKGCYGMTEYAAYYAMNKLAECAVKNLGNVKICAQKYLHFRREGIESFRREVSR